jgi:hypothetical protein
MNTYFIAYTFQTHDGNHGVGNGEIFTDRQLSSIDVIRGVENAVRIKFDYAFVCLTNFILIDYKVK